jgi:hypothetical protein
MAIERPHRTYEAIVPDRRDGETVATLAVDGQPTLVWEIKGATIEGPGPFSGRSLGAGFTQFTSTLSRDEAEAALVLRRAVFVSQGRGIDLVALGHRGPLGGCWAWQAERVADLRHLPENRRDFSHDAEPLLADDAAWLGFQA